MFNQRRLYHQCKQCCWRWRVLFCQRTVVYANHSADGQKGLKKQNWPLRSLKVTRNGAIRWATYSFLLVFNCNYMAYRTCLSCTDFSERELTFTFAICYRRSVCRLSVVCLWRWCALLSRSKFSAIFLRRLVCWPSTDIHGKFYGDRPRGTPPSWSLNARWVTKYSDF